MKVEAPIPRFLLSKAEAAASLGMSVRSFERNVYPELVSTVCRGRNVYIPVDELEAWVQLNRRGRL